MKARNFMLSLAIAVTGLGLGSAGFAGEDQNSKHPAQNIFDKIDQDNNGVVSFEEFATAQKPVMAKVFQRVDQDHNGKVSKDELAQALAKMADHPNADVDGEDLPPQLMKRFDEYDADHDGSLTLEEFAAGKKEGLTRKFGRLDGDGNGVVTKLELQEAQQKGKKAGVL